MLAETWGVVDPSEAVKQVDRRISLPASMQHVETKQFYTLDRFRQENNALFAGCFQNINRESI